MNLAEIQRALLELVRGERPADGLAEALNQPLSRVAIYRDFVRGHITGILAKLFPVALELVDERASLEDAFFGEHPARHRDLNLAGEPFPAFLDGRGLGFAAAVAQLEWEIFQAAVHPAALSASEPTLNPTLSLFEQHYPAVQYLARGPQVSVERMSPPQVVMVFRRPSNHVAYQVLDESAARVLTALGAGVMPSRTEIEWASSEGFVIGSAVDA